MRKFLLGATALVFAFTMSKCTFNGPAAYAGNFAGCTNVWSGGKLTKTGVCDLGHSKNTTGKVQVTKSFTGPTGKTRSVSVGENRL
jgi:hypothetical protein